jgi:hypothetical protein
MIILACHPREMPGLSAGIEALGTRGDCARKLPGFLPGKEAL